MPCPPRLAPFAILAAILALTTPSAGRAGQPKHGHQDEAQLKQVQSQIHSQRDKLEDARIKILNLRQEIDRIVSQMKKSQTTLQGLQAALQRQEAGIRGKEQEIAALGEQKEVAAEHVKKRLAAFYQTGEVGVLNALFASGNLGELLNLQEYVQKLFQHDQQSLGEFRRQLDLLAAAQAELVKAKERSQALIGQVKEGEAALAKSQEERDNLLAKAKAEEKLYQQALQSLEADAERLTKTIAQARRAEALAAKRRASAKKYQAGRLSPIEPGTGFAGQKGRLPPPAAGKVLRKFGPYQDNFGNQLHNEGLDLMVPAKSEVRAIHAGRVIFAGLMPGYGQMVIIDHGDQYYSLASGLAALKKKKGDQVRAGEEIGLAGGDEGGGHPGLHLEIRHGSTALDPLLWFDSRRLKP